MEIFTIGHSTHTVSGFVALLRQHQIELVVDVRSHPWSRHLPHFNQLVLEASLKTYGINYQFAGQKLGARPEDGSCYVQGKVHFPTVARKPWFIQGLEALMALAQAQRSAIMCSEQDPLQCHRAILVGYHLQTYQWQVRHILRDGALESQAHLESRLVSQWRFVMGRQLSLWEAETPPQIIQQAYLMQGQQIAYTPRKSP